MGWKGYFMRLLMISKGYLLRISVIDFLNQGGGWVFDSFKHLAARPWLDLRDDPQVLLIEETEYFVASLALVVAPHRFQIWHIFSLHEDFSPIRYWVEIALILRLFVAAFRG